MSGEDVTGNPLDRVRKFCEEYVQMRGMDPDLVYGLHLGDEHEAVITISDLRALLAECEARQKEVEELRSKLSATQKVLQFADGHSLAQTGYVLARLYASDCAWAQQALADAGCHPRDRALGGESV